MKKRLFALALAGVLAAATLTGWIIKRRRDGCDSR